MTKWFRLEGSSDNIVLLHARGRDTFHSTRLLQAPSNLALDSSKGEKATTLLDSETSQGVSQRRDECLSSNCPNCPRMWYRLSIVCLQHPPRKTIQDKELKPFPLQYNPKISIKHITFSLLSTTDCLWVSQSCVSQYSPPQAPEASAITPCAAKVKDW